MSRLACVVALSFFLQLAGSARSLARSQSSVQPTTVAPQSAFEPLDRWKAAVLAGSQAVLATLYTTLPPAQAQTSQGTTQDPGEEPRFWSAQAASGLNDFQPKVLAIERRQPNEVEVVLRIEGKVHTSSGQQTFFLEAHQLWVLQGNQWLIAATRRSEPSPSPLMRLPEPAKPNTALSPTPRLRTRRPKLLPRSRAPRKITSA